MLSSNSSCNHNPYTNYRPPFPENDITSSSISKLEDPYSSSFSFSFPNSPHMHLEYEDVYLQFLELFYHEQQSITTAAADHEINITAAKMADSKENAAAVNEDATAAAAPPPELQGNGKPTNTISSKANHHHHQQQLSSNVIRKRCSKKDRHSKINTARGPRDRRMRLSLDIARKFFDLQDLLGFDKASRTVEWLLRKSSPAIRDLARGRGRGGESLINDDGADHHHHVMLNNNPSSESSTCEDNCEVVSSTVEEAAAAAAAAAASNKTRRSKKIRKVGHRTTVARESRRKARERARERTSQKKRLLIISEEAAKAKLCGESVGLTHTSFKENDPIHHVHVQPPVEDLSSDEARILDEWNPSTLFNYQDNAAVFLHQDEQLAEFQFNGKPWEAFNSFNLSG